MARMYPEELSNTRRSATRSLAEVVLYDALAESLSDEWVVFYSIPWQGHSSKGRGSRDGETDFIVAHPDLGALAVEVKGGRIRFDGPAQLWVTTDADDVDHEIRPFGQARDCKYALRDYLAGDERQRRKELNSSIHDAVAFPECVVQADGLPPDAPRDMIIDGVDMKDLDAALRRVFTYHRGERAAKLEGGPALVDEVVRRLAASLTMANPLALSLAEEELQYVRLTEEQVELLYVLQRRRRLAVSGCAGSGKTMLAMEKAQRLARDGFRTLLTCFNKGLAGYLAECARGVDGLVVANYHKLCVELAHEAGVDWAPGEASWAAAPDALMEAVQRRPDLKFDAIIVDEGQDFEDAWWASVLALLASQDDGILYVFFDDNQRVYRGKRSLPTDLEPFALTRNVRNTRAIFRCVAPLYQGDDDVRPGGPSGRTVEPVACAGASDMREGVSRVVHRLVVDELIRPDQIVVLTPNSRQHSQLKDATKLGATRATWEDGESGNAVRISTIHGFKGQERPVVVVCELDEAFLARDEFVQLAYVAFSRPQHHLVVVGTRAALDTLLPAQRSGVTQ